MGNVHKLICASGQAAQATEKGPTLVAPLVVPQAPKASMVDISGRVVSLGPIGFAMLVKGLMVENGERPLISAEAIKKLGAAQVGFALMDGMAGVDPAVSQACLDASHQIGGDELVAMIQALPAHEATNAVEDAAEQEALTAIALHLGCAIAARVSQVTSVATIEERTAP